MPLQSIRENNINIWDGIPEFILRKIAPLCEVCDFPEIKNLFLKFINQTEQLNSNFNPSKFVVTVASKNTQCPVVLSNHFDGIPATSISIADTINYISHGKLNTNVEGLCLSWNTRDLVRIAYDTPNPENKLYVGLNFEGRLLDKICDGYQDRLPSFSISKTATTTLGVGALLAAAYSWRQEYKKMAACYALMSAVAFIAPYYLER